MQGGYRDHSCGSRADGPRSPHTEAIHEGHLRFGRLCKWNVHARSWRSAQAELADICHNANDFPGGKIFKRRSSALANQDALTKRVLSGPQLARHRLIDHDDRSRISPICLV